MTVFDNTIENYYAGRKEAFETLGSVNIRGLELNGSFDFGKLLNSNKHELILGSLVLGCSLKSKWITVERF